MAKSRSKNRIVAAITAFFGGAFGLHKLYLGDVGGFIFFIFLFFISVEVFPVTVLLAFFESIRYLSMSDDNFDRRYNRNVIRQRRKPGSVEDRKYKQEQRAKHRNIAVDRPQRESKQYRSSRANPFKKSGIKKHKDFDLEAAIEDFKQGLELNPDDIALHWNIACSYSLTEQKKLAYHHLHRAVTLGFTDLKRIQEHGDLAYVRIQPEYDAFRESQYQINPLEAPSARTEATLESMPQDGKLLSQLNKLAELRKKGLLSEDEFLLERKKLMRR